VLQSVVVAPSTVSLPAGTTAQLAATASYSDGTTEDVTSTASWTVSGNAASVSPAGLVTGLTTGSATVSATVGGVSGSAAVTVTAPLLRSVAVTPSPVSVVAGIPQQLSVRGTYSDGSTRDLTRSVTWASANTTRATVTSTGVVTGKSAGTVDVTATLSGVTGRTTVTVRTLRALDVTPALAITSIGRQLQLKATGYLSDGTKTDLTSAVQWTSGLPLVATVSSTGLVTGRFIGVALVFANVVGITDASNVTVLL
jgi:uncharacterized protein YjdB